MEFFIVPKAVNNATQRAIDALTSAFPALGATKREDGWWSIGSVTLPDDPARAAGDPVVREITVGLAMVIQFVAGTPIPMPGDWITFADGMSGFALAREMHGKGVRYLVSADRRMLDRLHAETERRILTDERRIVTP